MEQRKWKLHVEHMRRMNGEQLVKTMNDAGNGRRYWTLWEMTQSDDTASAGRLATGRD